MLKHTPRNTYQIHKESLSFSERVAIFLTKKFGTMITLYVFVIYGALGAVLISRQPVLLYWSNWIQLWSLPLLMVGTNLLSRHAEIRAEEEYKRTIQIYKDVEEIKVLLANKLGRRKVGEWYL